MDIIERVRDARKPFSRSPDYDQARAHNALLEAEVEILKLQAALETIGRIVAANSPPVSNGERASG